MEKGSVSGGGGASGSGSAGDEDRAPSAPQGKSCKGCLYFSSILKSDSRNPICIGLTRPLDDEVPTHSQPAKAKPEHASRSNFFDKFSRSAGIVASGVGRNLVRVGYSIKNNFEDILYDRKRPK